MDLARSRVQTEPDGGTLIVRIPLAAKILVETAEPVLEERLCVIVHCIRTAAPGPAPSAIGRSW